MGNIFKVLRRDFLCLFKVPAAWVILFGMVFIPPLYSWYNIVGFWDPYGNTKEMCIRDRAIAEPEEGRTAHRAVLNLKSRGYASISDLPSSAHSVWNTPGLSTRP